MDQLVLLREIRDLLKQILAQSNITHTFIVRNHTNNCNLNTKLRKSELKLIEEAYDE